jgi:integrase
LLKQADRRSLQGNRDYTLLLSILSTELRKAELCNLKGKDIKTYRNSLSGRRIQK